MSKSIFKSHPPYMRMWTVDVLTLMLCFDLGVLLDGAFVNRNTRLALTRIGRGYLSLLAIIPNTFLLCFVRNKELRKKYYCRIKPAGEALGFARGFWVITLEALTSLAIGQLVSPSVSKTLSWVPLAYLPLILMTVIGFCIMILRLIPYKNKTRPWLILGYTLLVGATGIFLWIVISHFFWQPA